MLVEPNTRRQASAHVIVLGNEKGGSGKSTTAMHVAVALMNVGQRVATIDLDFTAEELHALRRQPACLGQARASRSQGSAALLRGSRLDAQARRERADRIFRLCRSRDGGRAVARLHRRRYAGHRQLSDAARSLDGRHADHAAQRQLRRLRRARHRRRRQLRGHRRKSLRRNGPRRAPSAAADRRFPDGLDRGAQPAVHARLAQQASGRRGLAGARQPGSAFGPSTALPSGRSIGSSFRAG